MPMSFFVLQNNVFYVLLGYFLEKAVSTEKCRQLSGWKLSAGLAVSVIAAAIMVIADRKLSGEYHESVLNLMIPLMACCSLSWCPQIFCNAYEYQRNRDHSMSGQLCIWRILTGAYRSEVVPEAVFAAGRADIRNICMLCLYLLYFAV